MPYRPLNEKEKAQVEAEIKIAKEILAAQMKHVQELETSLTQGNWYMSQEEHENMLKWVQDILDRDKIWEERRKSNEQRNDQSDKPPRSSGRKKQ